MKTNKFEGDASRALLNYLSSLEGEDLDSALAKSERSLPGIREAFELENLSKDSLGINTDNKELNLFALQSSIKSKVTDVKSKSLIKAEEVISNIEGLTGVPLIGSTSLQDYLNKAYTSYSKGNPEEENLNYLKTMINSVRPKGKNKVKWPVSSYAAEGIAAAQKKREKNNITNAEAYNNLLQLSNQIKGMTE